jgi:hypothetical protein
MPSGQSINVGGLGRGGLSSTFGGGGGSPFSFMDMFKNLGGALGSKEGGGLLGLGSLALQGYGLDKSIGFAEDQRDLLEAQEGRAATAQNFQTGNSLSLALQTTTPGSPEHERIKQAMASGSFEV